MSKKIIAEKKTQKKQALSPQKRLRKKTIKRTTRNKLKLKADLPNKTRISQKQKRDIYEKKENFIQINSELKGNCIEFVSNKSDKSNSNERQNTNFYKMRLYPLNKINNIIKDNFDKLEIDKDIIIKFFNIFDINDKINFEYLKEIKKENRAKYNKLIKKYKYTLSFNNSKKLKCLTKEEIDKEIDLYNSLIKIIGGKEIKEISCFSKLKLFNFLLFLITIPNIRNKNIKEIKSISINIKQYYEIKEDLLFKGPNSLGTVDLQYYTLIFLFYSYLYECDSEICIQNDDNDEDNNDSNYINTSQSDIFEQKFVYFDDSNYQNNFSNLKNYFKDNLMTIKYRKSSKVEFLADFEEKIHLISIYKRPISEIVQYKLDEDSYIIEKLLFILYSLYFGDTSEHNEIVNCLDNDIINIDKYKKKKLPKEWNYQELCKENYSSKNTYDNLFMDYSKMFRFPYILKKNTLMNINRIYLSFIDFVKYIYKSDLIKEVFYNTPEFKNFLYPFDDEKMLKEVFENTWFMPYKNKNSDLCAYTEKLIAKIFIPANFRSPKDDFDIEALINFFANLLITILHEQFKHYLKMLIFYNSFIYEKKIDILSNNNLSLNDKDDEIYLNIIKFSEKYNNPKKKKVNLPLCIDGGHKLEIMLFGNIIYDIFISASLYIFTYSSWKKNIKEHLIDFIKLNSKKDNSIPIKSLKIKDIENNKDIPEFLILILEKYLKIKKIKNGIININTKYCSSRRISKDNTNNYGVIDINLGYSTKFNRERRDCRI